MPTVVTCRCGQSFRAIDELAGKQVNCPSCAQPLAIPPLPPATSSTAGNPLDLGNVSGFEQSAAPVHDSLAGAGGYPLQSTTPAYSGGLPRQAAGTDRSVVLTLWIGGGVVVVLILAMVITSLIGGSGDAPTGQSVAEVEPEEASSAAPTEATPEQEKLASKPIEIEPTAAKSDDSAPKKAAKKDRRKPTSQKQSQTQPSKTSGITIELSAGTALAQTLPTGTAMGFGVHYKITNGQPDSTAEYLWVIQTADGQSLAKPVRLESKGTLQDFAPQLRPENGPFQSHIEDQRGRRLSESIKLR